MAQGLKVWRLNVEVRVWGFRDEGVEAFTSKVTAHSVEACARNPKLGKEAKVMLFQVW